MHNAVTLDGRIAPTDAVSVFESAAAGLIWWLEALHGLRGSRDEMLAPV